jgi:hypothetical protein
VVLSVASTTPEAAAKGLRLSTAPSATLGTGPARAGCSTPSFSCRARWLSSSCSPAVASTAAGSASSPPARSCRFSIACRRVDCGLSRICSTASSCDAMKFASSGARMPASSTTSTVASRISSGSGTRRSTASPTSSATRPTVSPTPRMAETPALSGSTIQTTTPTRTLA